MLDGVGVLGELGLDGSVRPVPGVLALVDALARRGWRRSSCRSTTAPRPRSSAGVDVRAAAHLAELRACLKGEGTWPDWPVPPPEEEPARRGRRPRGGPRPAVGPARARDRGRGRPPPPPHRAARRGARRCWRAGSRTILAATRTRRSARGHAHPLGRGARPASRAGPAPGRSGRRTTPRRPRHSSGAAAADRHPAR